MPNSEEIIDCLVEEAHLGLFSTLSGMTQFWHGEYENWGAVQMWQRLRDGAYKDKLKESSLGQRVNSFNYEEMKNKVMSLDTHFIFPGHPLWPKTVDISEPPPIGLLVRGEIEVMKKLHSSISIVGTRNPTRYGERIAGEFSASLADRGWVSVSGGALGIDAAVHRGSLLAEGETIAVLASSLDSLYPQIHQKLFEHISQSGLLISETPFGHHCTPARFLHRNRLIASLSRATIVIEAPYRSGALRTARDANKYLRPVFATPGPITSPASEGVHQLIIERQAELVVSLADLIALLPPNQEIVDEYLK